MTQLCFTFNSCENEIARIYCRLGMGFRLCSAALFHECSNKNFLPYGHMLICHSIWLYYPMNHNICALPITRNIGPLSSFRYGLLISCPQVINGNKYAFITIQKVYNNCNNGNLINDNNLPINEKVINCNERKVDEYLFVISGASKHNKKHKCM